jgi:type II secretory pathway pseudopilin PulG
MGHVMRRRDLSSVKLQVTNRKPQFRERGYMMITLMLFIALVTIALLAVLPDMKQQIQRDREEELMHRGTAYMRAIQHFYKKLGRYPNRLEDLENTNNLRFLRRHYTDPVNRDPATGKEREFKLLHQQDITLNNGPVLGLNPGQSQPGQPFGQNGQNSPSPFGGATSQLGGIAQPGSATTTTPTGNDSSNPAASSSTNSSSSSGSSSGFNGPTFGGGPILGVASLSKEKTIRVFFDKNHYKDWLFIYVPGLERGGLLSGPVNPNMQNGNPNGLLPGAGGALPGQLPGQGLLPGTGQGLMLGPGQGPSPGQVLGQSPNQSPPPPQPQPEPTPPQQ